MRELRIEPPETEMSIKAWTTAYVRGRAFSWSWSRLYEELQAAIALQWPSLEVSRYGGGLIYRRWNEDSRAAAVYNTMLGWFAGDPR